MRHAKHLGHRRLELAHQRAVVGEPAPVQRALDAFHQPVAIADVGTTDVERLSEGRRSSADRELGHAVAASGAGAR